MKKAMNQSKLNLILNGIAITALLLVVVLLFVFGEINGRLMDATEDRFNLT